MKTLETYRRHSVMGFLIGVGGGALAAASASYPPVRTVGNAALGLGWMTWLGYAALARGELDDLQQEPLRPAAERISRSDERVLRASAPVFNATFAISLD